ncbi:MAG: hypothetical protein ACXV7J_07910 [Methylomonas sp.]
MKSFLKKRKDDEAGPEKKLGMCAAVWWLCSVLIGAFISFKRLNAAATLAYNWAKSWLIILIYAAIMPAFGASSMGSERFNDFFRALLTDFSI